MREIKQIIIHCADTYTTMDIGREEINQWHLDRGWSGIGYGYVIRRNGVVEPGRDLDNDGDVDEEIGAHTRGFNANSIGICMVGGKALDGSPESNFTWKQWKSLRILCEQLQTDYDKPEIVGHCDLDSHKTCPNFNVKAWRNA
jgi:N-acetylmuramoyl-L-alanine amidase